MEVQHQAIKQAVEVGEAETFAIVLVPQNLMDVDICGRKTSEWVVEAVTGFEHSKVNIKKGDDVVGIAKVCVPAAKKYCVVAYADTPLLTRATIDQALSFCATYNHKVVQMPRGWVFDMDYLRHAENINATAAPNLDETDFTILYNYGRAATITSHMRGRINDKHMENGVFITDPYNVYIDADVKIGKGTKIGPGTVLRGNTEIGENCKLINFVELKNAVLGNNVTVKHMSYVGDTTIGDDCNVGCGVVFCNTDGKRDDAGKTVKYQSRVGRGVFIGSNSNIISPVEIGDNAFVAAGSTITENVPDGALALARARQAVKENYHK
jgi:bifunctional N-acetylglucosamine-1-phosphate-uridyltransferase/glucosamine-1-phosphate-acetyltransferase GlmU-like protein